MSVIKPFRALRPRDGLAKQVSCVPYDVCSRDELAQLVENNPISFLRVTRAEAEVSAETDSENQAVFDLAKRNLQRLIDEHVLSSETEESLYVYRLTSETRAQTGVVACCPLDEYEKGLIKRHEKVRPDKVRDRTRHIVTVRAQTGLIFLAHRGTRKIADLTAKVVTGEPLYDFVCSQNVRHQIWKVSQTADLVEAFAEVSALYVADGHHRIAAANLAREILTAQNPNLDPNFADGCNYVVAGIFPADDLRILPYNRVVKNLNDLSEADFLHRLSENFNVAETDNPTPEKRGEICLYSAGKWRKLQFIGDIMQSPNPIDRLDVSVLQNYILNPVLGIQDVQTDKRIEFVGGIRGTAELEKLVDSGEAKAAFSMFPTALEDLFDVSDAGEIMPPKSTWFEPKLRDGLLVHLI